jgi:hypothetical protein
LQPGPHSAFQASPEVTFSPNSIVFRAPAHQWPIDGEASFVAVVNADGTEVARLEGAVIYDGEVSNDPPEHPSLGPEPPHAEDWSSPDGEEMRTRIHWENKAVRNKGYQGLWDEHHAIDQARRDGVDLEEEPWPSRISNYEGARANLEGDAQAVLDDAARVAQLLAADPAGFCELINLDCLIQDDQVDAWVNVGALPPEMAAQRIQTERARAERMRDKMGISDGDTTLGCGPSMAYSAIKGFILGRMGEGSFAQGEVRPDINAHIIFSSLPYCLKAGLMIYTEAQIEQTYFRTGVSL